MKRADQLNSIHPDKKEKSFGVTKFSDRSYDEYKVLLGRTNSKDYKEILSRPIPKRNLREEKGDVRKLAVNTPAINWVDKGIVTPIKNQGQCGSCWANSATEQVESQWAFNGINGDLTHGGALTEFSVQQINSCTPGCDGCGGGFIKDAFDYIQSLSNNNQKGPGIIPQAYAPYVQSSYISCSGKHCTESCSDLNVNTAYTNQSLCGVYATISSSQYAILPCTEDGDSCDSQDMTALANYVAASGTAAICLNAQNWNSYTGGVMTVSQCGGFGANDQDHCVQLVGYNSTAATPYWIVRNSWSTDWGESGYIYLEFPTASNPYANACGLANDAMYVTLQNGQAQFNPN